MVDLNGMEPEVPSVEIKLPSLIPQEESIESQVPEFVNPFAPVEEKKPASYPLNFDELISTVQELAPKEAPVEEDFGDGITAKIGEATKDWNGVLVGSVTYNLGVMEYVSGGIQVADDWHGNHAIYHVEGTGVQAGSSGKVSFGVGWLKGSTIKSAEGFSVDIGGSLGLGYVEGVSIIFGQNDYGKLELSGFMVNIGAGGALEGHISMSNATKIVEWNKFDILDKFWLFLKDIFDGSTNTELCKN